MQTKSNVSPADFIEIFRSKTMVSTEINADICASEIMESIPVVMYFIRKRMRERKGHIVSVPQVRALAYLSRHSDSTLNQLADYLAVSNATTCSLVDRLVQRGFIDRREDPRERRCVKLNLTKEGQEQYRELHDLAVAELAEMLTDLAPHQLKQVNEGLSILRNVLTEAAQ
ncbi:MAG: MarR family winged helix-turn-helix transcriptional regulator [Candidatus Obscuribacterales bacterium]|jgi:DNA-binding MarR family transcriptional regulator|nr:MarR family winged helix-turn-helix transcriptional regulator [Candidatus Obscuribacterales bacterium]